MGNLLKVIDELHARWKSESIEILAPSDRAVVIASLSQTSRRFSADVVDLYCVTGGMAHCKMDNRCFSLWPVDDVVLENQNNRGSDIYFSDFLIHSHYYAFRYENETESSVWIDYLDGEHRDQFATSVVGFFEILLHNPGSLRMFD